MSLHIEVYHHFPGTPDTEKVLIAMQAMETKIMSAFTDLLADDDKLIAEVQLMVDRLAQVPAEIATAVQAALDKAGVDPAITAAAIADADAKVKAAIAQVTSALGAAPPPAPVVPTVVPPATSDTGPGSSTLVDSPPVVQPDGGVTVFPVEVATDPVPPEEPV